MAKTTLIVILMLVSLMLLAGCSETTLPAPQDVNVNVTPDAGSGTSAGSESINPNAGSEDSTSSQDASTGTTETPAAEEPPATEEDVITLAELAAHDSQSDCWVAYEGEVYDVTAWLPRHPGGVNAIARHCGTADEFQKAFTNQHGTSKVSNLKRQVFVGKLEE